MPESNVKTSANISALFDFSFSRFITISIVKFLYGLVLLLLAIGWVVMVVTGFRQGALSGVGMIVLATLVLLVEVILVRVWLEVLVVLFRIGENTSALVRQGEARQAGLAGVEGQPPAAS